MMHTEWILCDGHLHTTKGLEHYDLSPAFRNIIYNDVQEYREVAQAYRDGRTQFSLILSFRSSEDMDFLLQEIAEGRVQAVKVHSRILRVTPAEHEAVEAALLRIPDAVPVIFDAFYDGPELEYQASLEWLSRLTRRFTMKRFIIAHAGGYDMLKYFFHLRSLPHVYFCLSLSLFYLHDSHVRKDMAKLIRYVPDGRVLFGTDHPFAPAKRQWELFLEIAGEAGISDEKVHGIGGKNYMYLFGLSSPSKSNPS